jgi:hypothetical protein
MLHDKGENTQRLEDFYQALNEDQKSKVEDKLRKLLNEGYNTLPAANVNSVRYQIASDMFQILKG